MFAAAGLMPMQCSLMLRPPTVQVYFTAEMIHPEDKREAGVGGWGGDLTELKDDRSGRYDGITP